MAIYVHIYNLIIRKHAVIEKYLGGIEQFRIDYNLPSSEINQEDDELFSLGQMNADQFDVDSLISKGLSFDAAEQKSDDFVILYRYGDLFWEAKWIEHNKVFAWHIKTSSEILLKVDEISNMTMDDISEQFEKGNNLFKTIRNGY
jgi:hypothetical protein